MISGFARNRANFFDLSDFVYHKSTPIRPRSLSSEIAAKQISNLPQDSLLKPQNFSVLAIANSAVVPTEPSQKIALEIIQPVILSSVSQVDCASDFCLNLSKRDFTVKKTGLCRLCELINEPMNWQFNHPTIVQGTTNPLVKKYIEQMIASGVDLVASVSAGEDAEQEQKIPLFDLVADVVISRGKIKTSVIFVPPYRVLDAGLEAIASGVKQLIIITPKVPPLDMVKLLHIAKIHQVLILGSGSSGLIQPEQFSLGTLEPEYFRAGKIGIIGSSRAVIYEVAWALNQAKLGQSWAVSLGQDKIIGSIMPQWLTMLDRDRSTEAIILIQSVQNIDYDALNFVAKSVNKPVICYVFGSLAPADKIFRKGLDILKNHLSHSSPSANSLKKITSIMNKAGIEVANEPAEIPYLLDNLASIEA